MPVARPHVRSRARSQACRSCETACEACGRVGVPWDVDDDMPVYFGTVIGVRSAGTCLRVQLDVGAGRQRLRNHTIPVHELFAL